MGMYETPARSDELYHYGVMGMHWGVRRYQNPDGSLTDAGRRKYNIGEAKKTYKSAKRNKSAAYDKYRTTSQRIAITKKQRQKKTEDVKAARDEWKSAKSEYNDAKANLKQVKKDNKTHLSENQKKAIKIGAAAVVAGLAVYGGYKLAKNASDSKKLGDYYKKTRKVSNKDLDWDDIKSVAEKQVKDRKEIDKVFGDVQKEVKRRQGKEDDLERLFREAKENPLEGISADSDLEEIWEALKRRGK